MPSKKFLLSMYIDELRSVRKLGEVVTEDMDMTADIGIIVTTVGGYQ